jgi:hypothetical protein
VGYDRRLASVSSKKFDLPADVVNSLGVQQRKAGREVIRVVLADLAPS